MVFQNQYLSTITRHLHNMVETSLDKLNDSTDLSMFESFYALKDLNDDLENQTTMVTTLADIFAHSGNSKYNGGSETICGRRIYLDHFRPPLFSAALRTLILCQEKTK